MLHSRWPAYSPPQITSPQQQDRWPPVERAARDKDAVEELLPEGCCIERATLCKLEHFHMN